MFEKVIPWVIVGLGVVFFAPFLLVIILGYVLVKDDMAIEAMKKDQNGYSNIRIVSRSWIPQGFCPEGVEFHVKATNSYGYEQDRWVCVMPGKGTTVGSR